MHRGRATSVRTLHRHPKELTLIAWAIAAGVIVVLALYWDPGRFIDAWDHLHLRWLAVSAGTALAALIAYIVSYRALMHFNAGPDIGVVMAVRIVSHGFGPFVPAGGFDVDKRALEGLHGDRQEAGLRVFAIGAMELAVLAPIACGAAIDLLLSGTMHTRTEASVLWPWAIGVPAGFLVGFLAIDRLRRHADPRGSGIAGMWGRAVQGAWMLADLGRQPLAGWPALAGMAAYWVADIASFIAAARFLGVENSIAALTVAYATGYALTRRSLPLGGAGITEALLTFALHWMGVPISSALAVVVVYRLFNFVLPALPALWAHGEVSGLFATAYEDA